MERILEQFPMWQSEIEQLFQENVDFQEMCQDFEEVRCLLTTWTTPTDVKPATIDEYQALLKDLKAEILEALQARFQLVELTEEDAAT